MNKSRIITRTVLLISFVSFFNDIASEMLYPVMPIYLRSIGFSILLIGILEGIAEATAGLSKGYFGNLSDLKRKRLPFIQIGYTLSALSKPLMALFIYPLWIFFARTLDRLGKGVRTGSRDAILSDETTREHKGKVFGFHRGMDTLGAAIGPALALVYLYFFPEQYRWLFFLAFIPGMAAILLTFFIREKKKSEPASTLKRIHFLSYLSYWKQANSGYRLLVAGLLLFTLFNSSDVFLLLAVKEQGLSDIQMIGVYIFYNLIFAVFSYPIGWLADRIGLKTMLIIGLIIFVAVYFGFGWASSMIVFGILFFGYGLYAACTDGISKALLTNQADRKDTATAIGLYTSLASLLTLLSSSLAGFLWFTLGARWMFVISGTGVGITVLYFLLIMKRKGSPDTSSKGELHEMQDDLI
ncbi:MAG: MFS transporter [Bacteroidia bacterium]|nr:MFS transporter [Bacteroidia bacterium]